MGDLVEESGSGRSAQWLWRETAVAIATTVALDIRDHKLLAVRAIATGWILWWGWWHILLLSQPLPGMWGRHRLWAFAMLFTLSLWPAIVGWVVAHTHRTQQASMVLAYAASIVVWGFWYFIVHYSDIKAMPIPNQLNMDIGPTWIALVGTLVGGFFSKSALHSNH
jgi:hypothetical protein